MTNKKQELINQLCERYAKTLGLLNATLDELDKKPKEVIVEVAEEERAEARPSVEHNKASSN